MTWDDEGGKVSADSLNYHHLLYFWTVAREGSIAAACEKLHVAQPTISGQLKKLEQRVGGRLYHRVGRDLVLTELGQTVYKYADEIFTLGQELSETLEGRPSGRPTRLRVGVPEVLPKLIVFRLLQPTLTLPEPVQLICHEGSQQRLLTMLAANELDVLLSDSPAGSFIRVKAFNHRLGQSGVGLYGTRRLHKRYGQNFPEAFVDAPLLLPGVGTALRRSVEQWLHDSELSVKVVGEFDDTALMKVFAKADVGLVPAPIAVEDDIRRQFDLHRLCVLPGATEHFYAITVERKLRHPAVVAISQAAREELFAEGD